MVDVTLSRKELDLCTVEKLSCLYSMYVYLKITHF
jgi:hypothetical protein